MGKFENAPIKFQILKIPANLRKLEKYQKFRQNAPQIGLIAALIFFGYALKASLIGCADYPLV